MPTHEDEKTPDLLHTGSHPVPPDCYVSAIKRELFSFEGRIFLLEILAKLIVRPYVNSLLDLSVHLDCDESIAK